MVIVWVFSSLGFHNVVTIYQTYMIYWNLWPQGIQCFPMGELPLCSGSYVKLLHFIDNKHSLCIHGFSQVLVFRRHTNRPYFLIQTSLVNNDVLSLISSGVDGMPLHLVFHRDPIYSPIFHNIKHWYKIDKYRILYSLYWIGLGRLLWDSANGFHSYPWRIKGLVEL